MTSRTKRKVGIVLSVVFVLLIFMLVMNSRLENYVNPVVDCQPFDSLFMDEVGRAIPYAGESTEFKYSVKYHQMSNEVTTELLLGKITDSVALACRESLFRSYVSYVKGVSQNILSSGEWNHGNMSQVQSQCNELITSRFCTTDDFDVLADNLNITDKYFRAVSLIGMSHTFLSVNRVEALCSQARELQVDLDLQICDSLLLELDGVLSNLYEAHVNYVRETIASSNSTAGNLALDQLRSVAGEYGKSIYDVNTDLYQDIKLLELKSRDEAEKEINKRMSQIDEDVF